MSYAFQGDQWVVFADVESFETQVRASSAGRGGPGYAWGLSIIPNNRMQNLFKGESSYNTPEIHRIPLDNIVYLYHLLIKKKHWVALLEELLFIKHNQLL